MKKNNEKILKVIYFDEGSAIDYIDVCNGGVKNEVEKKESKRNLFGKAGIKAEAKIGILFKALKPFLNINMEGDINGEIVQVREKFFQTTISNTVLTDFIMLADIDQNILKLKDYTVSAYNDSISFIKMYTPYLNLIKLENEYVNFSTIDETLEKVKGFYELVAENKDGDKKILRFNIKAFRNNYKLVDLTKMKLTFYSIEVGKMKLSKLIAKNEFDSNINEDIITAGDILSGKEKDDNTVPFFDVILAGIISNE
jgi:hypothetical protein